MKKLLFIALMCLAAVNGWADEQKKITLSSDNTMETVNLSFCNIFVTLTNPNSDEAARVQIEIENLDESKLLALFNKDYNEKKLKKLHPSFQYDKSFGGSKGKRKIDPYNLETDKDVFIEPSVKYTMPLFKVEADKNTVVHLPIYLAKSKEGIIQRILGKEKLLLLRNLVVELDIEVSMKPSAEYLALEDEFNKLTSDLDQTVFCTHKNHRPKGVEKQQEPFVTRIDELKAKIDAAISAHGWNSEDGGYKRYTALKEKIDSDIDLNKRIGTCRQHRQGPTTTHQCAYCSLSLQQIYHKLDDLYKKIYTSSDRQATKTSVMGQVNGLYNCCTAADCAKHASQWRSGGDYKNKIVERYNRIQGL